MGGRRAPPSAEDVAGPPTMPSPAAATKAPTRTSPGVEAEARVMVESSPAFAAATAAVALLDETPEARGTLYQQMTASEEHWQWKLGLRVLLVVVDIATVAIVAWLLATPIDDNHSFYGDGATFLMPFVLIPTIISLIWCLTVILMRLLRRPPRPVHPGVAVGLDLVLWLGLIITVLITMTVFISSVTYTAGLRFDTVDGDSGSYSQAPNGTLVYVTGSSDDYYLAGREVVVTGAAAAMAAAATATATGAPEFVQRDALGAPSTETAFVVVTATADTVVATVTATTTATTSSTTASSTRDCEPDFTSCAQQDAYVNRAWHQAQRRHRQALAVAVLQGITVVLHFVLFVWACVDTHRRNRAHRRRSLAVDVLQDMCQRGYVMVPAASMPSGVVPGASPPGDVSADASGGPDAVVSPPEWPAQSHSAAEKAPAQIHTMPRYQ